VILDKEKPGIGKTKGLNLAIGWSMNVQLTNYRFMIVVMLATLQC
jgi:hypothetical protein